ncbi:DUF4054 domain-containing protein [uncultured Megasphaera sp.]|uniref:DUF4054 domain-containing protein n=1 Tax=uncultured Megasphaera sp. TaxID=165188 RepID=UPI00265D4684|nr:DUF4054 domain-containing protein [uncultured Megasphaera sp.]
MTVDMSVFGIIANASNIRHGDNPEYTKEDFLAMYPQFGAADDAGNPQIPDVVMDAWLKMAQAAISKARYGDMWDMAMGFFVAHWLTLYLQTAADADAPVGKIISAGLAKGLQTSKSAGDLSVSYDFSIVAGDFDGWGTYKYTMFGQQLITLAKVVSMGGMCVW